MTEPTTTTGQLDDDPGPSLTPYLAVRDARAALSWYQEVFGAGPRGQVYELPDGSIGHAELAIGDSVLMLSEGSDQVPVAPPAPGPHSHTLHLKVPDVDAAVALAQSRGAAVERPPVTEPYGRVGVIVDPFGHRWMLMTTRTRDTGPRPGEVGYITFGVPDGEAARRFYGAVLGWRFEPGAVSGSWRVADVRPMVGLAGGGREVQLCYRVADVVAAVPRVRAAGGRAGEIARLHYGLLVDCSDDQGIHFQLWQPVD